MPSLGTMHILFCSHSYHQSLLVSGGTIKMIPSLITVILTLVLLDPVKSQQSLSPYYPAPLSASALLTLGGADFLPEDSVTAVGLKQQLIRRYHYLEYIKSVYKQLKKEYTRCAFSTISSLHRKEFNSGIIMTTRLLSVDTIKI